jgi:hypothetical protein
MSGNIIKPVISASDILAFLAIVAPRIMALMISAAMLSKRSAPRAAQSPTLSPTRSAIVAGFRGSSSGMSCLRLGVKGWGLRRCVFHG